ncbi:MAG: hypothetical protein IKR59_06215 [Lachnospiraceae bacterium]|nr:hypothetical protein [Lachnospiraceae bacterium]
MSNKEIAGVFSRMSPDSAASARMLAGIMERKDGLEKKTARNRRLMIPVLAAAALFVLLLAGGAFFGIRRGWFSPKSITVTLDGGEELVFEKGKNPSFAEAKIALPYEVDGRRLTDEEFASLVLRSTPGMYCGGTFKRETGEIISLEGKVDIFSVNMAVPGIAVTDEVVSGNPRTGTISGVRVETNYCIMPRNSRGKSLAVFSASFKLGDISIYITAADSLENAGKVSQKLGAFVQELIRKGEPDFQSISY